VGLSRKQVTRVLHEAGRTTPSLPPGQSKLDPFRERIAALVDKRLTATRILREIQAAGYTGRRTILAQHVARLRAELELSPRKQAKHRFETAPGEEIQIDWSPYMVVIAGRTLKIKAFGALLCASRKLFLRFYRDERQPTLLEAMASAFEYFKGCSLRVVLDNMATAVLSRGLGPDGQPLWHPSFLDFARYYGFTPFACAVRDPDRKGKKEKSFRLVWDDFLKGTEFGSWDELDERRRVWLDETPGVGNLRIHGTTRRVPNEAWLDEQTALIQLPEHRFPVYEKAARIVDRDATIWVRGTPYTVPSSLAERTVAVHLFAEHFEVLDPHGRVVFSRRYVPDADKGRLVIDPTHYAGLKRRPRSTGDERIEDAFVKRFPDLVSLVEGLKLRLKAFAPIHVRALVRLVDRYGEPAFLKAARRAQEYRRFDATAVERILERTEPLPEGDLIAPLHGLGPVALGEVEPPSLAHYEHLDAKAATETRDEGAKDDPEVNHGA
jgi:transposase